MATTTLWSAVLPVVLVSWVSIAPKDFSRCVLAPLCVFLVLDLVWGFCFIYMYLSLLRLNISHSFTSLGPRHFSCATDRYIMYVQIFYLLIRA